MMRSALFALAPLGGAQQADGLSLLQLQAHSHRSQELPDPKKKSSFGTGTEPEFKSEDVDFMCANGKGKWILTNSKPSPSETYMQDLSVSTRDIKDVIHYPSNGENRATERKQNADGTWGDTSDTIHGPVKNEKDCFARAKIDYKCNHWVEDIRYQGTHNMNLFVWYKPTGDNLKKSFYEGGCFCGFTGGSSMHAYTTVADGPTDGTFWACQLRAEDTEGVTPETKIGDKSKKPSDGSLPDPKKQSALKGSVDIVTKEQDFQCAGGKGKWTWTSRTPYRYARADPRVVDLTNRTQDIQEVPCHDAPQYPQFGGKRCVPENRKIVGGSWTTATYTEHGPVKDEKDCYARARIDQQCAQWLSNVKYGDAVPSLGVWYKPGGQYEQGHTVNGILSPGYRNCQCGFVDAPAWTVGEPGMMEVGNFDYHSGYWFCQLHAADFEGVDENTPRDLTVKEKKTPEERDACKAAKAAQRATRTKVKKSREAIKAARDALNVLRNQLRAEQAEFRQKKDAKIAAC